MTTGKDRLKRAMQDAGWQDVTVNDAAPLPGHEPGLLGTGSDAPYGVVVDAGRDGHIEGYRGTRRADGTDAPQTTERKRRSGSVPTPNEVAGDMEQMPREQAPPPPLKIKLRMP